MNFEEYQIKARLTAIYDPRDEVIYPSLGLASEAGEVLGKIKKQIRDDSHNFMNEHFREAIKNELGDCLWYLATLAYDLKIDLDDIAQTNIDKLNLRQQNNTLSGNGDNR